MGDLVEWVKQGWDWLGEQSPALQGAAALVAILAAAIAILRFIRKRRTPQAPLQVVAQIVTPDEPQLTLPQFIRIRTQLRDEILAELDREDVAEERTRLQARIDELTAQINNPDSALAVERQRLADLEQRLIREGNELGAESLQSAIDALRRGETDQAEAIFTEITAREALAVERSARAEYGLGEIAEGRVDWAAAARHYARAADLHPTFDALLKAREFAWRMGDYPTALNRGTALLEIARKGDDRAQLATAMNAHATTLHATGRYDQAEPLFREALQITRDTLGARHPTTANRLNNLAALLNATGRYDEAEPLYREALEITRDALGPNHPTTATNLNNLAELLRATGRYDEAEPLYRETLQITRDALGPNHPTTAASLNNLAELLRMTGRYDQAEPLHREALQITRDTLDPSHPDTAIRLNNLALLLRATDRADEATPLYLESLAIVRAAFGDTHPNTHQIARNTLIHLREHAPGHPDLPGLAAAFPD